MKRGLLIFIFIVLVFFSTNVNAQCAENLNEAQDAFDSGHLYGIPALLSDCVDKGSKQDKIEAYRLLTLTYLYIDDPIAAQNSFISLLKLDPEYRVDSTNHIELLHLSKEYVTSPIVSWSLGGGVNLSNISVIHPNGIYNTNQNKERYQMGVGGNIVGTFELHFSKVVSFRAETDLNSTTFKYFNTVFDNNGEQNAKDNIEIAERTLNFGLPLTVKLTYPGENFYPYVYGGYSLSYNILTNSLATYTNNEGTAEITTDNSLNISDNRVDFAHSYLVGLGVMRRFKYNYVYLDIRYKIGMRNRLERSALNEYSSSSQNEGGNFGDLNKYALEHLQHDNDFRQNELTITAGYVWPKYKPRKRRSVTAKSFIADLFKKKNKDE